MQTNIKNKIEPNSSSLGKRVKSARLAQGMTLDTASVKCGVSRSTLSKVENDVMSPTFDILQKIVHGLSIDLGQLFGSAPPTAPGRRTITRKGAGQRHATRGYHMEVLAAELAHKAMYPFRSRIHARSLDDYEEWGRHDGEEFIFVLNGTICLYSELYAPTELLEGDSIYFDSRSGHAVVSTSAEDAEVLWLFHESEAGSPGIDAPQLDRLHLIR